MGSNILATMGNLYVYLGIFHGLIAKKPIPGPSEPLAKRCQQDMLPQQYDEKNINSLGKLGVFPWLGLMSQCTGLLRSEDGWTLVYDMNLVQKLKEFPEKSLTNLSKP